MTVLSKFDHQDIKFLDIDKCEYNLGVGPNLLIDKFIHQMRFYNVFKQMPESEVYDFVYYKNDSVLYYKKFDTNIRNARDFDQKYYNYAKSLYRA